MSMIICWAWKCCAMLQEDEEAKEAEGLPQVEVSASSAVVAEVTVAGTSPRYERRNVNSRVQEGTLPVRRTCQNQILSPESAKLQYIETNPYDSQDSRDVELQCPDASTILRKRRAIIIRRVLFLQPKISPK